MHSSLLFLFTAAALGLASSIPPRCQQTTIPVTVTAHPQIIDIQPPKNQSELTGLLTRVTSLTQNVTTQDFHGPANITATYKIWTLLCVPPGTQPSTVEFAVHGINADHRYWTFGGPGSKNNYADVALKAGHAIFIYDRLGVGHSCKPDGIKEVQQATQIVIAAQLINYLKSGKSGHNFSRVIGIGHSFGSLQLAGVAAQFGNLLDATVLTGFTPFTGGFATATASFGLTIASQQNRKRFGSLSNSYVTTGSISNDQMPFLTFPFFDPAVLKLAEATKGTATIGEFLTLQPLAAPNYTNPLFVVTGDKDLVFCGGNCFQPFGNSTNLVAASQTLFPAVQKFDYIIPANVGHGVNLHFQSPDIYAQIQSWIAELS
ncbi:hypothetical protein GALMADRAFT_281702 [Galerina marginata CBS 339.88]|uniref:AB hydrolase-1 domain-containing protein n=1 Tax=Galerina marginata (strain CBS 339.88) TaxID=685588 RepID=A0A067SLW4_GALM3|nr:hypothetical protein GALMADRAFT_281702 [Galerina marginata CBS 339.88]